MCDYHMKVVCVKLIINLITVIIGTTDNRFNLTRTVTIIDGTKHKRGKR